MKQRVAVVYMAHDGFTSLYTGVGTIARDFLLSFPSVAAKLREEGFDAELSLYAVTMQYGPECFGFSEDIKQKTLSMTREHATIHLVELTNGSGGRESYGTIRNWKFACISAATFVHLLEADYDKVIVIAVDTPFAQVANYYLDTYSSLKVQFIWLPQSTVRIHHVGKSLDTQQRGNDYEQERYEWEQRIISLANTHKQVRIGSVGTFMTDHLIRDYSAEPAALVDIENSLYLPRLSANKLPQKEISSLLTEIGVPLDRPLIFSFGRAEPYKGLDLVMQNADELIREHNYFVLILASPYSMEDPYLHELDELAAKHPQDIKIIYGLDFLTPHYIMQWQNTRILAILSRAEPFGLIPIESRYYNNPNLTLLVSDRDGLIYQVNDGSDGFVTPLRTEDIRAKFLHIASLSNHDKQEIARRGYQRVCEAYDQVAVDVRFLKQYLVHDAAFAEDLSKVGAILDDKHIAWCLGASGALYVQGVAVMPKDLDIIVDNRDFDAAYTALKDLMPGEKESFTFADKTGYKFALQSVTFPTEIACFDIRNDRLIRQVWRGITVPVHSLGSELEMYKQRPGKEQVVVLIEERLKKGA